MMIKIFLLSIITHIIFLNAQPLSYEAIFSFGDSISDTGNAFTMHGPLPYLSPYYGMTYFKHDSGRLSDGRLIIDFLANAYGLPFLPPYLNLTKDGDTKNGVNFAVVGAIALDVEYYIKNGITVNTSDTLSVQLGWFKKLKSSLCKSKEECDSYFKKSLFLVGEIGFNDIFTSLNKDKNVTKIREIVPPIIESITNTTMALIEEGATELGVPGNFPIGCNAYLLMTVNSTKKEDYDQFGCLIAYNTLIEYYNEQLKYAIETLRKTFPQANIMYIDYYNDVKRLYQAPEKYGLTSDKNEILKACLGSGGPYNARQGGVRTLCHDLSKLINWDGIHFTEAANKLIAKGLVEGPFVNPPLKSSHSKIT